jgi:hypothetical protein
MSNNVERKIIVIKYSFLLVELSLPAGERGYCIRNFAPYPPMTATA